MVIWILTFGRGKVRGKHQERSSMTKVVRFERDDGSTFTPPPDKSPFFQNAIEAGREIGAEEGFVVHPSGRSGGHLLKKGYSHGREHEWAAYMEDSGKEVSQINWEPSSSSSKYRKKGWEESRWEDRRPWKKQQWYEKF